MIREDIEKYRDIINRIKTLETTTVTDTVKGSSLEFPFVTHPVSIQGVKSDKYTSRELERLYEKKHAIDFYIDNIPDLRAKNLIDLHYRKGIEWRAVATRTGYSEDANKKYLYKFFKVPKVPQKS